MDLKENIPRNAALTGLVGELERAVTMIGTLDDFEFAISRKAGSSIAAHFRHKLD